MVSTADIKKTFSVPQMLTSIKKMYQKNTELAQGHPDIYNS